MATTHTQHSADHRDRAAVQPDHSVVRHDHGTMDVTVHQRTFEQFIRFMTWGAVLAIAVLIFLALSNA